MIIIKIYFEYLLCIQGIVLAVRIKKKVVTVPGRRDSAKLYQKQERNKVKFITMDLYKPYYKLMHKLFKNAILISDRFHIVTQARNALDNTRISLCYKSNPNYKKMKKSGDNA